MQAESLERDRLTLGAPEEHHGRAADRAAKRAIGELVGGCRNVPGV